MTDIYLVELSNKQIHVQSSNRNTRKRYEICSNTTIKTSRYWLLSDVFIVNFEYISYFFFVISIADFKQAIVCWIRIEWANKSSRRIESKTKQLEVVVINLKILLRLMFKYFSYCFFTFTQVIYWLLISLFFRS